MRRGVGISSLEWTTATSASYSTLSDSLSATNLSNLQSQLLQFQTTLKTFALKHGSKIKSDPEFRGAFSAMCNELGVDPLSGGRRGLWDWVGFGDWTFALAVQVVDVCLNTRDRNGGLHEMIDVINAVRSLRDLPSQQLSSTSTARLESNKPIGSISDLLNTTITEQDIIRAIKSLEPLGSGYSILTIGHKKFIRSVPAELDNDSLVIFDSILSTRSSKGFTTHQLLQDSQNWSSERVKDALNKAVIRDSMLWIDYQADGPDRFYAPVLFEFEDNQLSPPS
ncbi:hypothetical protein MJO28_003831 [Puccinia striiformis f. sp. tritici]|uniref:Vacuolar-sorting protein SNF8 n=3 Tax=Puccinia striiformis TaxID=27350 RepID=A0A0L0UXJ2_9BASI|nr:hypothetical protein Pst134EB_008671 [Puccinia striiformis f. sp. tritici]KAI7956736.1 hypothetical protein MJO28_003831 [Puccinia striiformis f. sp. tritici]KNE91767.1 hypothetical protein PSTG_14835 [Puccinia striiformis f. sp. tritici PST-78]POV96507.1 hypothetical protein PSHT_15096 [Puccinia striiformis]